MLTFIQVFINLSVVFITIGHISGNEGNHVQVEKLFLFYLCACTLVKCFCVQWQFYCTINDWPIKYESIGFHWYWNNSIVLDNVSCAKWNALTFALFCFPINLAKKKSFFLCLMNTNFAIVLKICQQDENLVSFIKGALRIRSAYQTYKLVLLTMYMPLNLSNELLALTRQIVKNKLSSDQLLV